MKSSTVLKSLLMVFVVSQLSLGTISAHAADGADRAPATAKKKTKKSSKKSTAKAAAIPSKSLSRDIVFSGSSVEGKYHMAGEAVAQVETEKSLDELIGVRKNFGDRLAEEKARLNSEVK